MSEYDYFWPHRQEEYITEDRPLFVAPHWRGGAIGCAKWTGVKVRDVLKAAGMKVDKMSLGEIPYHDTARIVNFIAEDTDETGVPYASPPARVKSVTRTPTIIKFPRFLRLLDFSPQQIARQNHGNVSPNNKNRDS